MWMQTSLCSAANVPAEAAVLANTLRLNAMSTRITCCLDQTETWGTMLEFEPQMSLLRVLSCTCSACVYGSHCIALRQICSYVL